MARARFAPVGDDRLDDGQAGGGEDVLGALLVHGERRGQDARMGVGHPQQFEQALHAAILAPAAMQRVEDDIGRGGAKLGGRDRRPWDRSRRPRSLRSRSALAQPRPLIEAHLAFGRAPAHQHGDAADVARIVHGTPTRLISHSSVDARFRLHARAHLLAQRFDDRRRCASPLLMRKLQCFSETCASPRARPRQPASSMSCQALCPGGFLKVEPPVLDRTGCVASRCGDKLVHARAHGFGHIGCAFEHGLDENQIVGHARRGDTRSPSSAAESLCAVPWPSMAVRLDEHVLDLASVAAGVHAQRAADGAGHAAQEFEPGDAGIGGGTRHRGIERGRTGADARARDRRCGRSSPAGGSPRPKCRHRGPEDWNRRRSR